MIKNEKGVSLATLVITVIIMTLVTGTITYTSLDTMKLRKLDDMYNDIRLLNQKVTNYYIENNELPVLEGMTIKSDDLPENFMNLVNNKHLSNSGNYYIIDLEKLGGITLKNGKQYKDYSIDNPDDNTDVYIINEASNIIYYLKGIEIETRDEEGNNINIVKYALEGEYAEIDLTTETE